MSRLAAQRNERCGTALGLTAMKVRDLIALLESHGWFQVRQKGSHRQFQHASHKGTVTVSGHPGIDVPAGTLHSVLKQAGLR
jgi:predicted RNA binding protein YcfA (HicA-like mRNA interferase family)